MMTWNSSTHSSFLSNSISVVNHQVSQHEHPNNNLLRHIMTKENLYPTQVIKIILTQSLLQATKEKKDKKQIYTSDANSRRIHNNYRKLFFDELQLDSQLFDRVVIVHTAVFSSAHRRRPLVRAGVRAASSIHLP